MFDRAEATARTLVDDARTLSGDGSLAVATASDVLVDALVLNGRAASEDTLALAERALQIKEATLGREHSELIPSLLNLGDVLTAHGEFDGAVSALQRALLLSERNAADSLELAETLDHLGRALSEARRLDTALSVIQRSLALRERRLPGRDTSIARTLEDLAQALQHKGDYARAGEQLRRALTIREEAGTSHPAYITTLNLLAQQQWFEGDLLRSKESSERAVTVAERTLRPDHPMLPFSLRFLADTLYDLGESARAHALTQRALALAERNFGANHHVTAEYINDLGIVELDLGDYESARSLLRRALGIHERHYGGSHEFVAGTLSGLARANARLGDYAAASRDQSRAVAIFSSTGGTNHPFVALSLTRLATVYNEEGRPRQALPLLGRALAIQEKNLGMDHRDLGRTLADLASTLAEVGQTARAQELASRALRIWERQSAPDAPEFATVLAVYARLQARRGDHAAAREYYGRALAIRAKVFGAAHPSYAEAQTGLAGTLAALGDMTGALDTARLAENVGRDHLHLMLRSLPERQALQYAAARPRGLNLILSLATAAPAAVPEALDGLIKSRALVLDEIAARHGERGQGGDGADAARTTMISVRRRLANLLVRGPGAMPPAQYASLVDAARQESEAAEQTLAEQSSDFRAERSRAQIGAEEVLAALPADSALVSIARYDRSMLAATDKPRPATGPSPARPRVVPSYVAFVLRSGQATAAVPLGSAQAIDTLVSQWRIDVAAEPAPVSSPDTSRSSRASGLDLRRRVWDPLTEQIGDARRVFVVPDGSLSLVPFAALPVGQRSYLLDRGPVIHYLSAERDVVPREQTLPPSGGLLAMGGASFDDRSVFRGRQRMAAPSSGVQPGAALRGATLPCAGLQSIAFQPLAGTRQEVRNVSALWPADSGPANMLLGRDASEAAFKRNAPGHRVLHLATHGFFLNGDCAPSASGTRGVGGLTSAVRRPAGNPLLLSGLALAGANRRASAGPDEDDGILTAEEVASLDLSGVEWAVLSACDTGVGDIRAGEGVFGLRRAFQVAGARTVVMSLWSVDDQATRAWMRALYEGRFQRALSTADAVHQASLSVLRDRRAKGLSTHPFYWAAFVAAGDWR
jgi:CHAT domain-containing protein/tetratricopeptide (TPR) repeat protein